jgi:hypothetical protein
MVTKILMCYNDTPNVGLHKSVRITIPHEWLNLKVKVLLKYYVQLYNGIFANKLYIDDLHLATKDDEENSIDNKDVYKPIPLEELISIHILDHTKIYVRHGKGIALATMKPTSPTSALVLLERVSSYTSEKQQRMKSFDQDDDEEDDVITTKTSSVKERSSTPISTRGLSTVPEESASLGASEHGITAVAGTRSKSTITSYYPDQRNDLEISNHKETAPAFTTSSSTNTSPRPEPVERTVSMITQSPDTYSNNNNEKASQSFASDSTKSYGQQNNVTTSTSSTGKTKLQQLADGRSVGSNRSKVSKSLSPTPSQRSVHYYDETVKSRVVDTPTSTDHPTSNILSDEEDAAIIRFRSILEWLGVHHTLYDGVVRALEVEISQLHTDEEKHELIKKKLGALLEASYLNASRKGTLSVTSGSITSRKSKRSSSYNAAGHRSSSNHSTTSKTQSVSAE